MAKHFNLADLFEMVADKVPERDALVCGEHRATFAQLDARANQLAHYLAGRGVGAGDHVGLYMYNCNEYLESMLATFKARAAQFNVNYRYVAEELAYLLQDARTRAVIYHARLAETLAGKPCWLLRDRAASKENIKMDPKEPHLATQST